MASNLSPSLRNTIRGPRTPEFRKGLSLRTAAEDGLGAHSTGVDLIIDGVSYPYVPQDRQLSERVYYDDSPPYRPKSKPMSMQGELHQWHTENGRLVPKLVLEPSARDDEISRRGLDYDSVEVERINLSSDEVDRGRTRTSRRRRDNSSTPQQPGRGDGSTSGSDSGSDVGDRRSLASSQPTTTLSSDVSTNAFRKVAQKLGGRNLDLVMKDRGRNPGDTSLMMSTISRDNTTEEDARNAHLLAGFGHPKKQFLFGGPPQHGEQASRQPSVPTHTRSRSRHALGYEADDSEDDHWGSTSSKRISSRHEAEWDTRKQKDAMHLESAARYIEAAKRKATPAVP
ncbi:uncharacterized protein BP5553_04970 [Venustampulla echinocandica]|uniref:Uncharacterized protein n=1 Tax=Venustampulla echinocandica TaxID=2656787 RepID=A0A370TPS3_9HELO|nr:uncharacterized protein BP5553_04970 [Venustampulla echinocandica]RDL37537.1 hypothetical protein BP5553_04970 [Venustampulla echinocandica]